MDDIQDSDLIKAQLAMDALAATPATRSKTQAPPNPPNRPTTETAPAAEALDTSAYKVWKDEATGKLLLTCGALLPPGYEQSDQPDLPWICPIRTCRALLPGLTGLGRHFGVVHRACRLNDNLDGTLTDLGRYADPTPGDGRKYGGITKSCVIVSKKYMSLAESPMVEPRPHAHHAQNKLKPIQEVPKRELRRRSQIVASGTIQVSAMGDDELKPQGEVKGAIVPSSEGPAEKILMNAKSGRPYNMWPDESGELKDLSGTLLPDKWALYTEHPTHQWICPVRSCRWLYSARSHLANHFKMRYYGCRFNDNLDGTFTIVKRPATLPLEQLRIDFGNNPPAVISRGPDHTEPLTEPQMSQNYINRKLREHRRGKSSSAGSSIAATTIKDGRDLQKTRHTERTNSSAGNARVISSDVGFDKDTDGRPYTNLLNPENNRYQVTRGLIPEGYKLDHQAYPLRPWICPIRSCRLLIRTQAAYSNHWTIYHPNVCVNDNQDGTFSIVEGHSKSGARVVSRGPMGYDESPLKEAQLPIKERERVMELDMWTGDDGHQHTRVPGQGRRKRTFNEVSVTPPEPELEEEQVGDPKGLRRYITSQIGGNFPDIDETELEVLLALPRRRDLHLKHPIPVTHTLTLKQLTSVIVQLTGLESPKACTACRRQAGPFKGCVSILPRVSVELTRLVSSSYRNTCANCLYANTYNACSIKKLTKIEEKRATTGVVALGGSVVGDETGDDAEDEADEEDDEEEAYEYDEQLGATVIRRSQRLPSIPPTEESEADMDRVPSPRKVITFKDPSPTCASASLDAAEEEEEEREDIEHRRASKRLRTREQSAITTTSIQATAAAARSLLVSREDLVTEDWERGTRGVLPNRSQPSENLVYSSSYLSANHTVQICKSTTLTTLTITSGSTHKLPLDRSRTQICMLVSGKLRVTVNDGEEEFVVGPRGVFKLSPGVTCLLENWCYLDAAVHVTTVADR
ncbi:hypothetical protein QBC32DRAFT_313526 [Pseudoneurospora amorphoporcata]|uniref:Uncharacterized protein n=1 Tax=Pseudoneurospora amorphoporcata TaxID=241081 RepID=A0AAN6SGY6_9PEZI|nr:hypothetical protein QBC32DRAFT_313526 [Pseudoneurospora amorphoporcata]